MLTLLVKVYYIAHLVHYAVSSQNKSGLNELCTDEPHYCVGPRILSTDNGRIISHPEFNETSYGPNLSCVWIILATKGDKINIQTTYMSVEYSHDCGSDSITFYDGNGINTAKQISKICGGSTLHVVKSVSNSITVRFLTDTTGNKMGFQLRYLFYKRSEEVSDSARPSTCGTLESRCSVSLECIANAWKCDGIVDCQDGSDEHNCVVEKCALSTIKCSGKCIPNEEFCGNISQCSDLQTKFLVPEDVSINETRTPRSGCSEQPIPNVERRVVGGVIARKGSWPWQISIQHSSGIFCGGSIITSNWIVTAAHCVYGRLNPSDWRVNAGKFLQVRRENTDQVFGVQRVIMHERYNSRDNTNDIAVMRIDGTFTLNNYVQPVCVARMVPPPNTMCYITGWGQTQGTGGNGYLKQAQLPIIDQRLCNNWYGGSIANSMVCAGYQEGGTDACQGDSGGPLVCKINSKYQLVGITSFGDGCALPQKPGVYSAAPLFLNWMMQALQSN